MPTGTQALVLVLKQLEIKVSKNSHCRLQIMYLCTINSLINREILSNLSETEFSLLGNVIKRETTQVLFLSGFVLKH